MPMGDVNDIVLVSLLLTLTHFSSISSVSIVDFERLNICWKWFSEVSFKVALQPTFTSTESTRESQEQRGKYVQS